LPDGLFSNQKSQFRQVWECFAMKDVGKFYVNLVFFTAISYIVWPFGIFCGNFGNYFPVLVCCTTKNLATLLCTWGQFFEKGDRQKLCTFAILAFILPVSMLTHLPKKQPSKYRTCGEKLTSDRLNRGCQIFFRW
jgi:hypothetical protein